MAELTISLCMIVKNEEKHLEKCLSSVQGKVDEIIIVDTGSSDSTIEIARYFGAKTYNFEWINDFSAARNYAISKATSDFILVLDADEYLEPDAVLSKEIKTDADYFVINIKNYNSNGSHFYHQAVRLFRNHIGLSYYGKLHEHLNIDNPKFFSQNEPASFVIHHTGYMDDVVLEKDKQSRNFEIIIKDAEESPTPYNLFNLGSTYFSINEYDKALEYLKRSFILKNNVSYIYPLLSRMIESLRLLRRYEEAITLAADAIERYPAYTDFHFLLGQVYADSGYLRDSELMFQKCIKLGDANGFSLALAGVGSYLAYFHLSLLFLKQNRYEEAFDAAFQAMQINKNFYPALRAYFEIMIKAKVSNQDVINHITAVYPVEEIQDVKTLFIALYTTRHPLLDYYVSNTTKLDSTIKAVAKLYNNKYDESRNEWLGISNIGHTDGIELLLLALILRDYDLLEKCKPVYNVREKEWNFIKKVINRDSVTNYKSTPWTEKILLTLCERLVILNEFEIFEYISSFMLQGTNEAKFELAKMLVDYEFIDVAYELLLQLQTSCPNNFKVLALIGDLNYRVGRIEEAESSYIRYINACNDYPGYERLYRLYEVSENHQKMKSLKLEIERLFPNCRWVRNA